jgi:hypothetical protein
MQYALKSGELCSTSLFYVIKKRGNGFVRIQDRIALIARAFSGLNLGEKIDSSPFLLLPECHRVPYGILATPKATLLNPKANKRILLRGEFDFHEPSLGLARMPVNQAEIPAGIKS